MPRALQFARLHQVQNDLIVRHQQERRLVDDRDVVQLLVRVLGGEDGHRRLVHSGPAHTRVEVAGRERRWCHPADAGPAFRRMDEFPRGALILRNEPACEIEGAPGNVRVDVDAAGQA